jgi:hypothetical protein
MIQGFFLQLIKLKLVSTKFCGLLLIPFKLGSVTRETIEWKIRKKDQCRKRKELEIFSTSRNLTTQIRFLFKNIEQRCKNTQIICYNKKKKSYFTHELRMSWRNVHVCGKLESSKHPFAFAHIYSSSCFLLC